ncbi:unnamed protein product, partial [Symbiodinium sp. KB8]
VTSLRADAVTYNAAMNACLHSTKERRGIPTAEETPGSKEISWRRSLQLRMELSQASLVPDLVSVNLALACFAAGRRWQEALSYGQQAGILGPDAWLRNVQFEAYGLSGPRHRRSQVITTADQDFIKR